MTLQEFCKSIIDSPAYRESVIARATAGLLSEELELYVWDMASGRVPVSKMADGRLPLFGDRIAGEPVQSKTLALVVRPSAASDDEVQP